MKMFAQEDDGPEVQMAPLIDCVFLLLVFFLVATTLKKNEPELQVDLPISAYSVLASEQSDMMKIGLDDKGNKYINGEPVTTEAINRLLSIRGKSNPNGKVRIDADRTVIYQDLIEVIELCQFHGLKNVGFHTRKHLDLQ